MSTMVSALRRREVLGPSTAFRERARVEETVEAWVAVLLDALGGPFSDDRLLWGTVTAERSSATGAERPPVVLHVLRPDDGLYRVAFGEDASMDFRKSASGRLRPADPQPAWATTAAWAVDAVDHGVWSRGAREDEWAPVAALVTAARRLAEAADAADAGRPIDLDRRELPRSALVRDLAAEAARAEWFERQWEDYEDVPYDDDY